MVINPPLILVSALFFLSLGSALYVGAWLIASLILRIGRGRLSHAAAKRVLITALILPPLLAVVPTVGGATFKHSHSALGMEHHSMLCRQMFTRFYHTSSLYGNVTIGWIANGLAWLTVAAGAIFVMRLIVATVRLERGIAPFLQPPSSKLASVLEEAARFAPRFNGAQFYECAIPAAYSSVFGLLRVRCILSREFVQEAAEEELLAVVTHEASHLRAHDAWVTLLVGSLNGLFFLVRPVRLLARRWREEAELACDDAAVALTGNPAAMASAILRVSGVPTRARTVSRALPATTLAFADEAACPPRKRVERLIAQAQSAALPQVEDSRFHAFGGWAITMALAVLGIVTLMSAEAMCYAHCSLEVVARLMP